MKPGKPVVADPGVLDVEMVQVGELLQVSEPVIADLGIPESQAAESSEALDQGECGVGGRRGEGERAETAEPFQMREAGVRDRRLIEVKRIEVLEPKPFELRQPVVAYAGGEGER